MDLDAARRATWLNALLAACALIVALNPVISISNALTNGLVLDDLPVIMQNDRVLASR